MHSRPVPDSLVDLLRGYASAGLGATIAYPGVFPPEFSALGISQRSAPRNEFIGTTVTFPDPDRINFGLSYDDAHDGGANEDMYSFNVTDRELAYYPGRRFERLDKRYPDTHRGNKDYLRSGR